MSHSKSAFENFFTVISGCFTLNKDGSIASATLHDRIIFPKFEIDDDESISDGITQTLKELEEDGEITIIPDSIETYFYQEFATAFRTYEKEYEAEEKLADEKLHDSNYRPPPPDQDNLAGSNSAFDQDNGPQDDELRRLMGYPPDDEKKSWASRFESTPIICQLDDGNEAFYDPTQDIFGINCNTPADAKKWEHELNDSGIEPYKGEKNNKIELFFPRMGKMQNMLAAFISTLTDADEVQQADVNNFQADIINAINGKNRGGQNRGGGDGGLSF